MSDKISSGQLFMGLVYSLTQSAFISLGKLPDPMSGKIEQHLDQASQTIDLLAALKEKTAGNLEENEEKFLGRTISDLRLNYVDEVNKAKSEKKEEKKEEKEEKEPGKEKSEKKQEAGGNEEKDRKKDEKTGKGTDKGSK
ncbi:MAG: DUF1844 domain-containing protein [Candidatus Marinimicrobia bacterium]|nr:DUF1844 domain-containing protein [Candidatus Neomarinimicrobiota bacterium]